MTRITNDLNVCVRGNYAYTGYGNTGTQTVSVTSCSTYAPVGAGANAHAGGIYSFTGFEYTDEPTTRVAIDPNVRVRGNGTYVGFEDVSGPIAVGDQVEVYEAESGLVGEGRVTEIDGERELVYLSVDWSSLTDEASPERGPSTISRQTLFLPAGSAAMSRNEDAWMTLVSRPCLAYVSVADTRLSIFAPALRWSMGALALWSSPPDLWIVPQSGGNGWAVAA